MGGDWGCRGRAITGEPQCHRCTFGYLADLRGLPKPLCRQRLAAGRGKKRIIARAEWEFGGGDSYCAACESVCPNCPARLNQPLTFEGWQVWDLVGRLGGQLRIVPGAVIGWDMGAAFALGAALGIPAPAIAELLPAIEAVMVRCVNVQIAANHD